MKLPCSAHMNGHAMNPEIEKARQELEKLKQREHELEERLSSMYACAGGCLIETRGCHNGETEEEEDYKHENVYENVYNGHYLQSGHTLSNQNHIKDPWIDDTNMSPSTIIDHRSNGYSALARAVTDKRHPVTIINRKSDTEEVEGRYPYPAKKKNENSLRQSSMLNNVSGDVELRNILESDNNKHEITDTCIPVDFDEHFFCPAYDEKTNDNAGNEVQFCTKNNHHSSCEDFINEAEDEVADQRDEIHREIKINQERERALKHERNIVSESSDVSSNSDSESVLSVLSIRSKILREIEEERLRDMEIQDQYRMRALIRTEVQTRSDYIDSLDDANTQKKCSISDDIYVKDETHHENPSCNVIDLLGGDASLRSKDNDGITQQECEEELKKLRRVLTEEDMLGEETRDSASELGENNTDNVDMRSKILKEIEEEQKREKELKLRLNRNLKRNEASPQTNRVSNSLDQLKSMAVENATNSTSRQNNSNTRVETKDINSEFQNAQNTIETVNATQCTSTGFVNIAPCTSTGFVNIAPCTSTGFVNIAPCTSTGFVNIAPCMMAPCTSTGFVNIAPCMSTSFVNTTQCMSTGFVNTTQCMSTDFESTHATSGRSLSEIDKCIFSSRDDLIAFLRPENIEESKTQTNDTDHTVQRLIIPKVFTSNTNGNLMNSQIKSPIRERKIPSQESTQTKQIPPVKNIPSEIPISNMRNKSSDNTYDELHSNRDVEKPVKKESQSAMTSHDVNRDDVKESSTPCKVASERPRRKFSKPVTVAFTITKTIQRWERRIKKNSSQ